MKRGNIFRFISHEDTSRTRQAFARRTAISTLPVLVPTQRHWSRWFRWWPWRSRRWRLRFWFRRLSGPYHLLGHRNLDGTDQPEKLSFPWADFPGAGDRDIQR